MIATVAFLIGGAMGTFVGMFIGNKGFREHFIAMLKSMREKQAAKAEKKA